jgi:hypothetical protein
LIVLTRHERDSEPIFSQNPTRNRERAQEISTEVGSWKGLEREELVGILAVPASPDDLLGVMLSSVWKWEFKTSRRP